MELPLVPGKTSSMAFQKPSALSSTARTGAMSSLRRLTSMRSFTPALRALPHPSLETDKDGAVAEGLGVTGKIGAR